MVRFAWIVCNSYDFHGRLGRRNEKALIFVNDLGILLIREDFRDFGDLGLSLVLSSILVILGTLQK
jgi:hypothetical protein